MPPIASTIRSPPPGIASKSPCERVRPPVIRGLWPVACSTCAARPGSSSANAPPTVPWPRGPMRKSDIAREQVVVGLAACDGAGVAARAEDDGRPRHAVVVVRHRVGVGAGGGRDEQVAGLRVVEVGLPHEHVAGLAVLAGYAAAVAGARRGAVGEPRL